MSLLGPTSVYQVGIEREAVGHSLWLADDDVWLQVVDWRVICSSHLSFSNLLGTKFADSSAEFPKQHTITTVSGLASDAVCVQHLQVVLLSGCSSGEFVVGRAVTRISQHRTHTKLGALRTRRCRFGKEWALTYRTVVSNIWSLPVLLGLPRKADCFVHLYGLMPRTRDHTT